MATTILQDARVFEVNTPTTIAKPTMLDNNKNVWSNVVLNCNCFVDPVLVLLPDLATLGNTLDCEIIINKVDSGSNTLEIIPFSDGLGYENFIGSDNGSFQLSTQWQSAILRPVSLTSWAIEFSA